MPGFPGAVSWVRRNGRQILLRTGEGAPGILLLTNLFYDSFECLSVIVFFVPNRRPVTIPLLSWSFNTKKFTCKLGCSPYPSGSCRKAFSKMSFQWKWPPLKTKKFQTLACWQNKTKRKMHQRKKSDWGLIEGKFVIYSNSFVPSSCVTEEKNLQTVKGTYLTTIYAELS